MRNKFLAKIVGAVTAFAMAIGVGAAIVNNREAALVHAESAVMSAGSNSAVINVSYNEGEATNGVRIGTSSKDGSATFSVAANTTSVSFYAVGWKGESTTISVAASVGTITPASVSLTSNDAATGTINADASVSISGTDANCLKTFSLSDVTTSSTITISSSGSKRRSIVWGATYDVGSSGGDPVQLSTPSNLSSSGATLSWTNVENNNGYIYSINTTPEATTGSLTKNTTSFNAYALTLSSGTYSFQIKAKGDNSNYLDSDYSDGVEFTISDLLEDSFTVTDFAATSSSYTEFSIPGTSRANYVGYSAKPTSPNAGYIQFNKYTSPQNRGIATSETCGYIRKVSVTWGNANNNEFTVYAGDTAYSSSSAANTGTAQSKTLSSSNTVVAVDGDNEYVSLYPNGAIYPASVSFYWEEIKIDQNLSVTSESVYEDETITISSDATRTVTWSVVEGAGTTAPGADVTSEGVISVTGPGTVTVKAVASGFNDTTKQVTFVERVAGTYYDVTFDSDGGSISPAKMSILEGETFEFPSPGTKDHYSFDGWTSDLVYYYQPGDTSPAVTEDIEYLGFWTKDTTYVVTYSAGSNGSGTFADDGDNFAGDYTLLPFNSLTGVSAEDGYRFKDYTVNDSHKNPGDTISLSSATEVTVNFEEIPLEYVVTFGTAEGTAGLSNFNNTSYVIPTGVTLGNMQGDLYGKNDNTAAAIRFGKGSTTGSFDVTISSDYYIEKVIANLKYYSSDTTAEFAVTPDGGDAISKSLTSEFADYEYDVSSSYVSKVTLGTTIDGKRAFLSGFTITYAVRAKNTIESDLTTNASLTYRYSKVEEEFTYSEVAIRFGGFMSKDLWDRVDLESTIQGYGVIVSTADYLDGLEIKDLYDIAIDGHTVDEALAELCDGTNIRKYSKTSAEKANPDLANNDQKTAHGVELSEDYYVWNLYLRLSSLYYKTSFTAVAYVRTAKNGIVFLNETTASVKSLATDLIAGPNYDEDSLEGSLDHLAKL